MWRARKIPFTQKKYLELDENTCTKNGRSVYCYGSGGMREIEQIKLRVQVAEYQENIRRCRVPNQNSQQGLGSVYPLGAWFWNINQSHFSKPHIIHLMDRNKTKTFVFSLQKFRTFVPIMYWGWVLAWALCQYVLYTAWACIHIKKRP